MDRCCPGISCKGCKIYRSQHDTMTEGKNEVHASPVMPHSNTPDVYQEVLDEYNRFFSEHLELQQ